MPKNGFAKETQIRLADTKKPLCNTSPGIWYTVMDVGGVREPKNLMFVQAQLETAQLEVLPRSAAEDPRLSSSLRGNFWSTPKDLFPRAKPAQRPAFEHRAGSKRPRVAEEVSFATMTQI